MAITFKKNIELAQFTSFGVGGPAENFVEVENSEELLEILQQNNESPVWVLGYGSNVLISDNGLPGIVIVNRGGNIDFENNEVIADAGAWWDDIVRISVEKSLWGAECLSEIPGSVGAALFINIAAYGQSIGKVVKWVEVWDHTSRKVIKLTSEVLEWGYKHSVFQDPENKYTILRACFILSNQKTNDLLYQKAIDVALELNLDKDNLSDRRKIIIESRNRASSIWNPKELNSPKTVGSFFRNPIVSTDQAESIMNFDESAKTTSEIRTMNQVHGGNSERVSAAHVMLAAGFKRGQTWDNVKLNDHNLLKIEALPGATAQEIYNVVKQIQATCEEKLGITLEPEAQILGSFG